MPTIFWLKCAEIRYGVMRAAAKNSGGAAMSPRQRVRSDWHKAACASRVSCYSMKMFIPLASFATFLATTQAYAGKLRYPETKPIVIDSPGKVCVSSGTNEVGTFWAACPANKNGSCPSTKTCAEETSIQPKEGKVDPGKYDPGKVDVGGAVGGDSRGNRAN